jgi:hypothetical protein
VKKYKISKDGKEISGVSREYGNTKENYVYTIYEGDKVVLGTSTNRITYKNGVKEPEDDYYKRDASDLAKFQGGYWGVVSSSKDVIKDLARMILSKKAGYVKDMDLFINSLGGVDGEDLDENDIKYADGGMMADGGYMADGGKTKKWSDIKKGKIEDLKSEIEYLDKYLKNLENENTKESYEASNKLRNYKATLQAKILNLEDEEYAKGGYMAKGGISSSTTYVPNRDVKELSVILSDKLKSLKGSDIVDGVYVKKSALKSLKDKMESKKSSKSTTSVDSVYDAIISKAKDLGGLDEDDKDAIKKEDIKKLINAGYDTDDIKIIYLGAYSLLEPSIDNEISRISGLLSYRYEVIPNKISLLVKIAKEKRFEMGLKYPNFNWSDIVKKYKISKDGKEISGVSRQYGNEKENYVYTIYEGDKVVLGTSTNRIRYKNGVKEPEDNYYKRDASDLAKFQGGYWGVVSSSKDVIKDLARMILSKKAGYVKDMDLFINSLGGVDGEDLDENDIEYSDGGMMAKGGMVSLSKYYKTLPSKQDLVGLRAYDENNDEFVYIKSVEDGIFAGKNANDEYGHYYDMSVLSIKNDGRYMADGGMMAKGGITEHGLKIGDKIIDFGENGKMLYITNDNKMFSVNIERGARVALNKDGGMMAEGGKMAHGGEMHRTQE